MKLSDVGIVKVKKDERERVARLRRMYPKTDLYRIRINNQEALDGKEPVTGCCNGDEFIIPREQDWVCPKGHLSVLLLTEFQDVDFVEEVEKGVPVWYRVHSLRQRYHLVVYGRLDLAALDKELAEEAKKAAKAAEKLAAKHAADKAAGLLGDGDDEPDAGDGPEGGDNAGAEA